MVIGAIGKGKKGKGKFGKGKSKSCKHCGKTGHFEGDCWAKVKGKGKDSSKGGDKTKFDGACHHCGMMVHRTSDCRKKAAGLPKTAKRVAGLKGACAEGLRPWARS